jgi:predicted O-methyltransferase YrrM
LQILAMDINRENYELGLPCIEKAGVAHKIDFREGPALPLLDQLLEDVSPNANRCTRSGEINGRGNGLD